MKVHREFVQYSPDYWQSRRGKPSASEFGRILTPGSVEPRWTCIAESGETCGIKHTSYTVAEKCAKRNGKSLAVVECAVELAGSHESYMNELIAHTIYFDPNFFTERPKNAAMEEGMRREPKSRRWYAMDSDIAVEEVGGCETDDGKFWCSPDGLVGEDGVLELKNPAPETQVKYLREGVLPSDYLMQCHGHLLITGRKWCDFVSYVPMYPTFKVRVVPDITTVKLAVALELFYARYAEAKAKVLQML